MNIPPVVGYPVDRKIVRHAERARQRRRASWRARRHRMLVWLGG